MIAVLLARVASVLIGLYYLAWVAPTFMQSFGSRPPGLWAFAFLLPLAGAIVSFSRPVLGGVIVLGCAAYEAVELIRLAMGPEPTGFDRSATIANSIPLLLVPALLAGALLIIAGSREHRRSR